jgi:hypothetical protein
VTAGRQGLSCGATGLVADRRAWFGDGPGLVADTAGALAGVGGGEAREGRLIDGALRPAAQTGAGVHLVPAAGGPADGLGALLRWS